MTVVEKFQLPSSTSASPITMRHESMAADLGVTLIPRPGTAFEYRDRFLYYCTEQQVVIEVDEKSYVVLAALLAGATYDETQSLLSDRGQNATPAEMYELLETYRDAGLFDVPDYLPTKEENERTLETLVRHQPMKMMLFMAQSCNLRCTYCYGIEGNYPDKGEKMTPELAERSVDFLFERSPDRPHYYIYFFGGEPLLNLPCIEHVVAYSKKRAKEAGKTIEFGITTNGTLLTDRALNLLIEEDFQICVSVDGDPEAHDVNRPTKGGSGSHQHVMKGVEKIRERMRRPNQLKIRATMSHQSHDPERIAAYFDSLGITNYGIGTAFERAGHSNHVDVTPEDVVEMDATFERLLDGLVDRLDKNERLPSYNPFFRTVGALTAGSRRAQIGCGLCRNDQGVGTDGDIYPCHRYVGSKEYVIGNVRTGIDEEKMRAVYRQFFTMWERHCRNCWARYACSGSCAWQHSNDTGVLHKPIAYQCESIRKSVQRSAWLSMKLSSDHEVLFRKLARQPTQGGCCNPQ